MPLRLPRTTLYFLLALSLAGSAWGLPNQAFAADIAWHRPQFQYNVKNRSLRVLLQQFAKAQHLRLSMADGIDGRVTGKVSLPADRILETLAEEHHFYWQVNDGVLVIDTRPASRDSGLTLRKTESQQFVAAESASADATPPAVPLQTWTTTPADKTLQNALARWSLSAGWQLIWELPQDFSIEAAASINGSFEDAVSAITGSLQLTETPVTAIFFEGNRVLRIVAKGAQP